MQIYNQEFYSKLQESVQQSARVIVPLILELIQPRRVIDVGCGLGTWLSVFREFGISDVLGVDGDYISRENLEIPDEKFISSDLSKPLELNQIFDLVVSLEVAEHLPEDCAETFINTLTSLGPLVLFSAAIPHQGGTGHVNEQWVEYWADLFNKRNYVPVDCLRRKIWNNHNVCWWYAQNILLFASREKLKEYPLLYKEYKFSKSSQLSIVHPTKYKWMAEWCLEISKNS
jgi:SAM-dependent methyltransferase